MKRLIGFAAYCDSRQTCLCIITRYQYKYNLYYTYILQKKTKKSKND